MKQMFIFKFRFISQYIIIIIPLHKLELLWTHLLEIGKYQTSISQKSVWRFGAIARYI